MAQVEKVCRHCGQEYLIAKKKEKTSKFCCLSCAYAHRTIKRVVTVCPVCYQGFDHLPSTKRKTCSKKCAAIYFSRYYQPSEETRKKLRRPPWNKGLTAKDDSRILSGDCNAAYGVVYRTKASDPEWAEKIRQSTKGKINLGDKNATKRPEVQEKMRSSRRRMLKDQSVREKIAERTRQAWRDGKFDGVRVGQCKWFEHKRQDGTTVKVQGTWELAFVEWADGQGLTYDCHRGRIKYVDEAGKERSYYPDFYVHDWEAYVDVKNDYHFGLQRNKFDYVRRSNPDMKLVVLLENDLREKGIL